MPTPRIGSIAASGVRFTRATSPRVATGAIGKWHLGMQPGYHPMDRGVDELFGMASGTATSTTPGRTCTSSAA